MKTLKFVAFLALCGFVRTTEVLPEEAEKELHRPIFVDDLPTETVEEESVSEELKTGWDEHLEASQKLVKSKLDLQEAKELVGLDASQEIPKLIPQQFLEEQNETEGGDIILNKDNFMPILRTLLLSYTRKSQPSYKDMLKAGGISAFKTLLKAIGKEKMAEELLQKAKHLSYVEDEEERQDTATRMLTELADQYLASHRFKIVVPESFLLHQQEMGEFLQRQQQEKLSHRDGRELELNRQFEIASPRQLDPAGIMASISLNPLTWLAAVGGLLSIPYFFSGETDRRDEDVDEDVVPSNLKAPPPHRRFKNRPQFKKNPDGSPQPPKIASDQQTMASHQAAFQKNYDDWYRRWYNEYYYQHYRERPMASEQSLQALKKADSVPINMRQHSRRPHHPDSPADPVQKSRQPMNYQRPEQRQHVLEPQQPIGFQHPPPVAMQQTQQSAAVFIDQTQTANVLSRQQLPGDAALVQPQSDNQPVIIHSSGADAGNNEHDTFGAFHEGGQRNANSHFKVIQGMDVTAEIQQTQRNQLARTQSRPQIPGRPPQEPVRSPQTPQRRVPASRPRPEVPLDVPHVNLKPSTSPERVFKLNSQPGKVQSILSPPSSEAGFKPMFHFESGQTMTTSTSQLFETTTGIPLTKNPMNIKGTRVKVQDDEIGFSHIRPDSVLTGLRNKPLKNEHKLRLPPIQTEEKFRVLPSLNEHKFKSPSVKLEENLSIPPLLNEQNFIVPQLQMEENLRAPPVLNDPNVIIHQVNMENYLRLPPIMPDQKFRFPQMEENIHIPPIMNEHSLKVPELNKEETLRVPAVSNEYQLRFPSVKPEEKQIVPSVPISQITNMQQESNIQPSDNFLQKGILQFSTELPLYQGFDHFDGLYPTFAPTPNPSLRFGETTSKISAVTSGVFKTPPTPTPAAATTPVPTVILRTSTDKSVRVVTSKSVIKPFSYRYNPLEVTKDELSPSQKNLTANLTDQLKEDNIELTEATQTIPKFVRKVIKYRGPKDGVKTKVAQKEIAKEMVKESRMEDAQQPEDVKELMKEAFTDEVKSQEPEETMDKEEDILLEIGEPESTTIAQEEDSQPEEDALTTRTRRDLDVYSSPPNHFSNDISFINKQQVQDVHMSSFTPPPALPIYALDPFYGPRLSRTDIIFHELKVSEEGCREQIVCNIYKNPEAFTPISDLLSRQLTVKANQLQKPKVTDEKILRFFRYLKAAKDGQDGGDCAVLYPSCFFDTISLSHQPIMNAYNKVSLLMNATNSG